MDDQEFEVDYLQKFNSFLSTASFSSTYKLVFLKSLLELADYRISEPKSVIDHKWIQKDGTTIQVDLNFIAVPFTKYYWDMFYKFRLRQSQTKNQYGDDDLNIHKNFKDEHGIAKKPPKTADDLASKEYDSLRKKIIERSIRKEVLIHLSPSGFYKIVKGKSYILMDSRIISFFKKYRIILDSAINYKITKYLEGINKSPQIAEKVLIEVKRPSLKPEEKKLMWKFHHECFYCGTKLSPESDYAIDHVIPFDYVLKTDLYNSVPACINCNSTKSNKLPNKEKFFVKVIQRNENMKDKWPLEDYTQESYEKLYRDCKEEYHGDREYFEL